MHICLIQPLTDTSSAHPVYGEFSRLLSLTYHYQEHLRRREEPPECALVRITHRRRMRARSVVCVCYFSHQHNVWVLVGVSVGVFAEEWNTRTVQQNAPPPPARTERRVCSFQDDATHARGHTREDCLVIG